MQLHAIRALQAAHADDPGFGLELAGLQFTYSSRRVIGPSPRDQCASAVCSTGSFHGLIFASVFARLAFATSVS